MKKVQAVLVLDQIASDKRARAHNFLPIPTQNIGDEIQGNGPRRSHDQTQEGLDGFLKILPKARLEGGMVAAEETGEA